jgi:hypothetical protein
MKRTIIHLLRVMPVLIAIVFFSACSNKSTLTGEGYPVTFYEVPLVCGAAPDIGCGSRIKPFFLDAAKLVQIKETWTNREGTVIAIIWDAAASDARVREKLIQPLFEKHTIHAGLIESESEITAHLTSLKNDRWYKGMDVDQLSIEEAGVIAEDLTHFALEKGLITEAEKQAIRNDLEAYFKKELVMVRTEEELRSEATQGKWRDDGYGIYVTHIGKERADSVAVYFDEYEKLKQERLEKQGKESCCEKEENGCAQ